MKRSALLILLLVLVTVPAVCFGFGLDRQLTLGALKAGRATLAGGTLFGLWTGTLLVSFASTLGATLSFLAARWLFRDALRARCGDPGLRWRRS